MIQNFCGNWSYTIAFKNKTFGDNPPVTVWVCEDKESYENRLAYLQTQEHIEIVQNGPSQVKSLAQDTVEAILAA